jgi:hypothetical protein
MDATWKICPLDFDIRLKKSGVFQPFKGVTLRGAFGVEFKKVVCAAKLSSCAECRLRSTCAFTYVFDTPAAESDDPALRSHNTHAPHPFAVQAPDDARTFVPEGTLWRFRFVLIGESQNLLPYFVHTFLRLAEAGLGRDRVPFCLERVEADLPAGRWKVYESDYPALRYPPSSKPWPQTENADRVTIDFQTLTRLKADGRIQKNLTFPLLARTALRRVSALYALYGGGEKNCDYKQLLDSAVGIQLEKSDIRPESVDRFSTRTRQRIRFDGFTGRAVFRGDLSAWLPLLRAAEDVNLGKGATFGFGQIKLTI